VAVTAGYVCAEPRAEFYEHIDAANIDLKAFDDEFYKSVSFAALQPVLETLEYVRHQTSTWLEVTTLLIPGLNDSPPEIDQLTSWIRDHLGTDVPLHFSAFHPDWKMRDYPPTPAAKLVEAQRIGRANGLRYVYTGNVETAGGGETRCHECGALLIDRLGYEITAWELGEGGVCPQCGTACAGVFESQPGTWGSRRLPVRLSDFC
jgi:pyruvate formate lyase activating enzyme